jgi:hypothetical protein
MLDKRGFLFTVTIFLILVYILLSISVWVKSVEASERSFSEFYKESTIELTMEQITPEKLDNVTYIIMNRALMRLNDHSIDNYVNEGPVTDENRNIRAALFELLMNGSANESYFHGAASIMPERNSSLDGWVNNLNASLGAIGIYVSEFRVSNFAIGQNSINTLNYSFDIRLSLRDYTNLSSVSRTYKIKNAVNITGLVDPALTRESKNVAGDNGTIYRLFLFNSGLYPDTSSLSVSRVPSSVRGGQGWIYSPIINASDAATVDPSLMHYSILVGTFDEITALTESTYDQFAGFVVTSEPIITPDDCPGGRESSTFNPIQHTPAPSCNVSISGSDGALTDKPFIVAPNFDISSAPQCPYLNDTSSTSRCILILNSHLESEVSDEPILKLDTSGSGLFDIEKIRDFVMCGYYTYNPNAPSYLQRLMADPYSHSSTEFGIETFVVGAYAGDYTVYGTNSRLDRELFNDDVEGVKVRGLPGCKNFATCSDSPITGIFAVSNDTGDSYGLDQITCDNGAARCDS